MREVSDELLLQIFGGSATLIGLFLIGVFFYAESGLRRRHAAGAAFMPYLRAGTRITLVLYAFPLGLPLALVAMVPAWSRVLFAVMSVLLVLTNIDSLRRIRALNVPRSSVLVVNEVLGTAGVVVMVVVPWALGGLRPSREDLTWSILISLGLAFLSTCALVMSAFDVTEIENRGARGPGRMPPPPRRTH